MSAPHEHGGPECRALFARLSEYLDGEMEGVDCAHIEAHLGDCPPCRDFLESLRRTVRLVQSDPGVAIPEETRRAILESWRKARRAIPPESAV